MVASLSLRLSLLHSHRSITCECLASFFYVFIVCGAAAGAGVGASVSSVLLATALSSGFSMIALTQCFLHISGKYTSPLSLAALARVHSIKCLSNYSNIQPHGPRATRGVAS